MGCLDQRHATFSVATGLTRARLITVRGRRTFGCKGIGSSSGALHSSAGDQIVSSIVLVSSAPAPVSAQAHAC